MDSFDFSLVRVHKSAMRSGTKFLGGVVTEQEISRSNAEPIQGDNRVICARKDFGS